MTVPCAAVSPAGAAWVSADGQRSCPSGMSHRTPLLLRLLLPHVLFVSQALLGCFPTWRILWCRNNTPSTVPLPGLSKPHCHSLPLLFSPPPAVVQRVPIGTSHGQHCTSLSPVLGHFTCQCEGMASLMGGSPQETKHGPLTAVFVLFCNTVWGFGFSLPQIQEVVWVV